MATVVRTLPGRRGMGRFANRELLVVVALMFVSIAFDFNVYVAGVAHVYVHDLATALVAVLAVRLAIQRGSVIPEARRLVIPLGLLLFLIFNTVVLGAIAYPSVPPDMRKLFWFEHGDALRIVGELFIWVWTFGLLDPQPPDRDCLIDVAAWACAIAVGAAGVPWYLVNARPQATTTFDLYVLAGLPIALVFLLRRDRRSDVVRLFVFGLATTLLYSRTTILAVLVSTVVILIVVWRPRRALIAIASVATAWFLVLLTAQGIPPGSTAATPSNAGRSNASPAGQVIGGGLAVERTQSLTDRSLAPYTISSRIVIWSDALRIAGVSPVFGVGYHNYFLHSTITEIKDASAFDPPDLFSSLIKQAHNDFLSWLAETGVVGLTLYLIFWFFLMRELYVRLRACHPARHQTAVALGVALGILAVSVVGEILIPRAPSWTSASIVWWLILVVPLLDLGAARRSHTEYVP